MWFYFTHKDIPYILKNGPTLGLPKLIHFTLVRMQLILKVLSLDVVNSSDSLFEFKNEIKYIGNIDCGCLI